MSAPRAFLWQSPELVALNAAIMADREARQAASGRQRGGQPVQGRKAGRQAPAKPVVKRGPRGRYAGSQPCGTYSGYQGHRRRHEVACEACQEANRVYMRAYKAARRAAGRKP